MPDRIREEISADTGTYTSDRAAAEDDGTALPERTDDFPPSDLYHASVTLAELLADDLSREAEYIGLVDLDPARWESLDVARVADYARKNHPDEFASVVIRFPWLESAADQSFGADVGGF